MKGQTEAELGRTYVEEGMDEHGPVSVVEPIPGMEVCDFCSTPNPTCSFEADDAEMWAVVHEGIRYEHSSAGAWAACATCEKHVKADDRSALLSRSWQNFLAGLNRHDLEGITAEDGRLIRGQIKTNIDLFFQIRK